MRNNRRFFVGLVGVAAVVTYLVWTGVNQTMVYYLTPTELMAKVESDPSFRDVGVKVAGKVVPGSYHEGKGQLEQHFVVRDTANANVTIPVVYNDILPETFTDDADVVLEGHFGPDGVFQAKTVLTKCGSRYEASPEELKG